MNFTRTLCTIHEGRVDVDRHDSTASVLPPRADSYSAKPTPRIEFQTIIWLSEERVVVGA